jgi:hypothetical protein
VSGEQRERELLPGLNSVPPLVRMAAGAWFRGAAFGVEVGVKSAERLGGAVMHVAGRAEEAGEEVARAADEVVRSRQRERPRDREPRREGDGGVNSLRRRGAELLDRAADVDDGGEIHPGFARIIDQLAPDEARILKLLINEGPQGIVYVNKAGPFGVGAREVARRLSMIGHEAGCLHIELVPAYLDNLVSHGLVAIRRDALEDELPYQVIEAQPEVIEALAEAGGTIFRGQVTRRSVHLTDFGRTFCQVCFPPEHLTGEFGAIELDAERIGAVPAPETVQGADRLDT